MNRAGLVVTLAVAAVVGLLFGVHPQFDLDLSAPFYDSTLNLFVANAQPWVQHARDAARVMIALLVAPAVVALVARLIAPRRPLLMELRTALFLVTTLAVGPGLLTNTLLKDHWGRPRPIDVKEFGGTERFTPWWDPRGECPDNCSFVAGEPSGAFWALAPASLAPPQWRLFAYGGAVTFGAALGVLRIGGGGHFFTDVVFGGVLTFLVVWSFYGLLYRWGVSSVGGKAAEGAGAGIRKAFRACAAFIRFGNAQK